MQLNFYWVASCTLLTPTHCALTLPHLTKLQLIIIYEFNHSELEFHQTKKLCTKEIVFMPTQRVFNCNLPQCMNAMQGLKFQ